MSGIEILISVVVANSIDLPIRLTRYLETVVLPGRLPVVILQVRVVACCPLR